MAVETDGARRRVDPFSTPIKPLKPRAKRKEQDKLISDFWLSVAGYTVMGLMCITLALSIRLVFHMGHIGYHHRSTIYGYVGFGAQEEL
mmetsp:Transcript_68679/g.201026  ORF Transcript_68679/g.201026 Transcript_68679/m.201026 type:complete len:89 (-) Transcript_68679:225-491(-)